jgi:hypothetical protein
MTVQRIGIRADIGDFDAEALDGTRGLMGTLSAIALRRNAHESLG